MIEGAVGSIDSFDRKISEGRNRIDTAGAEEDKPRAVLFAEFQHVDGAEKIMLHELPTAGFTINTSQHARVGGGIDHKIDRGKGFEVALTTKVAVEELDATLFEVGTIGFTAGANEIIEPEDLQIRLAVLEIAGQGATYESANAGDENFHCAQKNSRSKQTEGEFPCGRLIGRLALLPSFDDLADGVFERLSDVPRWIVGPHLAQVGIVADVVASSIVIEVSVNLSFAGEFFRDLECFENGGAVGLAATEVINFASAWILDEGCHETSDVERVNVIAHLFALVAEDLVFAAFEVAFNEVGKESMEFDAGVIGAGEAAAAQGTGGEVKIASVFLHHDIGGDFGSPEQRMFGLVDGKGLGDAMLVGGIGIIPACFELGERDVIGGVTIDLVGAHVDEGRFGAGLAGGFEQIERADGVGVEIVEGNGRSTVMGRLGCSVDDDGWLDLLDQGQHALPVANIDFMVHKAGQVTLEALLVPAGISLGAEKDGTLIVIHTMDGVAQLREMTANFGADKTRRTGDE